MTMITATPATPSNPTTVGAPPFPLSTTGPMYFICPTSGHCSSGMKLAVTVSSSKTTPGSSPSPPSTPTRTTAPPSPKGNGATSVFSVGNVMLGLSSVVATVIALVC